jgi:hypothetical protein
VLCQLWKIATDEDGPQMMRLATLLLVLNLLWIASDHRGGLPVASIQLPANPEAIAAPVIDAPMVLSPPETHDRMVLSPPDTHDRINHAPAGTAGTIAQLLARSLASLLALRW